MSRALDAPYLRVEVEEARHTVCGDELRRGAHRAWRRDAHRAWRRDAQNGAKGAVVCGGMLPAGARAGRRRRAGGRGLGELCVGAPVGRNSATERRKSAVE